MLLDEQASQLLLVDCQTRLLAKVHDSARVQANAMRLAKAAHWFKIPVWGTEHAPQSLGPMPQPLRDLCGQILTKMHFSAVAEGLTEWLRPAAKPVAGNARSLPRHLQKAQAVAARDSIVVAGCETHVCLLQTALDLLEDGFDVWVVTDASSSLTERNRDAAYDRLASAGVELLSTEMVLFEWLRSADHPHFKQVLELVKSPD